MTQAANKPNGQRRLMRCVHCRRPNTRLGLLYRFRFVRRALRCVKLVCPDCKATWYTPYP